MKQNLGLSSLSQVVSMALVMIQVLGKVWLGLAFTSLSSSAWSLDFSGCPLEAQSAGSTNFKGSIP